MLAVPLKKIKGKERKRKREKRKKKKQQLLCARTSLGENRKIHIHQKIKSVAKGLVPLNEDVTRAKVTAQCVHINTHIDNIYTCKTSSHCRFSCRIWFPQRMYENRFRIV